MQIHFILLDVTGDTMTAQDEQKILQGFENSTFELLSLCPAEPGWRALFSYDGSTRPVVAWGVFRQWQAGEDFGTSMQGIVANILPGGTVSVGGFTCAANDPNFERYLPPDWPGPSHG